MDLYWNPVGLSTGIGGYFTSVNAGDINADACATVRFNHRQARVYQMRVADLLENCVLFSMNLKPRSGNPKIFG